MARMPKLLDVELLEEGMELAADVQDSLGRVLARSGTTITDKHRRIFSMCGLAQVRVQVEVTEEEAAPDPAELAAREAAATELRHRFRHANLDHAPMARLFDEAVDRVVRRARWQGGVAHA